MKWFIYIIETKNKKLYTGITTNLERRFKEHKTHKKGAKFFNTDSAKKIVYFETAKNRSKASKREHEIKNLSRTDKLKLIST